MSTVPKPYLTPEQYLALDRAASFRSEYYRGEMFAMVGASRKHNLIALNVSSEIRLQLKQRRCEVYQSDMRVKVDKTGLYVYPDVVATCDKPRFEDRQGDVLLNPRVVVEVLSPSTELWDRGQKFSQYRQISSLLEYVLISQNQMLVERYTRKEHGEWAFRVLQSEDEILLLESIDCQIRMTEIYARVDFSEGSDAITVGEEGVVGENGSGSQSGGGI